MANPENQKTEDLSIPGVDVQKGVAMTGGRIDFYRKVLDVFLRDAEKRLPKIIAFNPEEELLPFITEVHALKGATASIGAGEISKKAGEIESAGKSKNLDFIEKNLEAFISELQKLINDIKLVLGTVDIDKKQERPNEKILNELALALEAAHIGNIEKSLAELEKVIGKEGGDSETLKYLDEISENILMTEYKAALEIVRKILGIGTNNGN